MLLSSYQDRRVLLAHARPSFWSPSRSPRDRQLSAVSQQSCATRKTNRSNSSRSPVPHILWRFNNLINPAPAGGFPNYTG